MGVQISSPQICTPNQMPLTDTAIRNAKAAKKPYKLHDNDGLFVLVHPNGSRYCV